MVETAASQLDLLTLPFDATGAIARKGDGFRVETPWSVARYGAHRLRGGWWVLDWEGDADPVGLDLRLSSAAHPLVVVPGDAADFRLHLEDGAHWHVSLLVAPWPCEARFSRLVFRRLGAGATARMYLAGAGRLLASDRPFERLAAAAQRVLSGRTVGVRVSEAAIAPKTEAARVAASEPAPARIEQSGLVAVLDQGDQLHPGAFDLAAQAFASDPAIRAVYADRIEGECLVPRPEWDEELAQHAAFAGSPVFVRAGDDVLAGAPRDPFETLKLAGRVARIPLPLASRGDRPAIEMRVPPVPHLAHTPRVSVIIPTKTQTGLLEACLKGLIERTSYPDLEVIVVDNGAEDPRFPSVIDAAKPKLNLKLVRDADGFNFPRLIHSGVEASSGEIILLLNDDIEARETGWLHRMVESALRPDVGAVGARLLYPDGTVQHAGCILGIGGGAGHMWKGADGDEQARNPMIALPGGRLAVTGACLAVRREAYDRMGGLDQANFPVAFNDIDFCLRLHAAGLKTLYRGDAVLTHHESKSRGADHLDAARRQRLAAETARFLDRWRPLMQAVPGCDPYGSPAFDPMSEAGSAHRSLLPGRG